MTSSQTPSASAVQAAQLFNVDGLVAVVTGGGTGIGLMMAKALAENGAAAVYIVGRRQDILESAAASIGKSSVKTLVCDVTSRESLQKAADTVKQEVGYLNLLICNSGIAGPQTPRPTAPAHAQLTVEEFAAANWDVPVDEYTKTFALNATGVWYTTMAFLTLLDAGNKKGNVVQKSQVIATSSIGGFNKAGSPSRSDAPGGYAYGQSKAAATHLVKQLAVALPTWDIRANVLCPGLYPSEMSAPIIERGGIGKNMIPLGRPGDESDSKQLSSLFYALHSRSHESNSPIELQLLMLRQAYSKKQLLTSGAIVGGTILYLASRAGAYCNGTVIVSDGGRLGTFPSTF
ncbi:short chain dehydrogenase [Seiridium cupressi]